MNRAMVPIELESEWLLIDAALVKEILGAQAWLPIPRARPELPGVLAFRGRAVPIVDLAVWMGRGSLEVGATRARTLIVEHEEGIVALPVDAAREVLSVDPAELRPAHSVVAPFAKAELDRDGKVMPCVDLALLLRELASASRRGERAVVE